MDEDATRQALTSSKSLVVKVGSSSIADPVRGLNHQKIAALAQALKPKIDAGCTITLITSGAIAAGVPLLGLTKRPADLPTRHAAASVGQMALTQAWAGAFAPMNRTVGQILLTLHDIAHRPLHINTVRTFEKMHSFGIIPIVNENDTLATREIQFGDNDRLAALVAHLSGATSLYLFSDVDGVYNTNPAQPDAHRLSFMPYGSSANEVATLGGSSLGTGGMQSKLNSAFLAAKTGIPVLLTSAGLAQEALGGQPVGTAFAPAPKRWSARRFWLHHSALIKGRIIVDAGAAQAVSETRKSLLIQGIVSVSGNFTDGEVVHIADSDGRVFAHGMTSYSSEELRLLLHKKSASKPIIHADDVVLL